MSIIDTVFRYDVDDIDLKRGYRVYRNLRKREWTVQHYVKGVGWRKFFGAKQLYAHLGGTFQVSEKGAARAVAERKKNVHAFFLTQHVTSTRVRPPDWGRPWLKATYSPYTDWDSVLGSYGKPTFFIVGPNLAIGSVGEAFLTADGVVLFRDRGITLL